jgi:GNAT superfamily N-acetyltransferase
VGKPKLAEPGVFTLRYLFIDEKHRGKGYSHIFVPLVEAWAKSLNGVKMVLRANEDSNRPNKLINFYKSLGYQLDNKKSGITYDGDVMITTVWMFKEL